MMQSTIEPVPFTAVQVRDTFWASRIETNRTVTIPYAFEQSEATGRIENFKVAAGLSEGPWQGDAGFNDSDVFKIIEGAAYSLMAHPDAELDAYLDRLIPWIAAAQEPDGYLYTAWTAQVQRQDRPIGCCYIAEQWDNIVMSHELYNVGHLYEAAVAHYQATGKRELLDVAMKNADLIVEVFGSDGRADVPGHQEIEIGLVKLYRVTGNLAYLDQAKRFLDRRGHGNAYAQDHRPVIEQDEAVGHAVRAGYMYSAMADVAALAGERDYMAAIDRIWENVVSKKLYVTGGIGARHDGEAFGDAYELPNDTAYCETCAAIANVYWNHRMFLLHGDAGYIDVMERSLYNNVLVGVSLDGKGFFYVNPLMTAGGHGRQPWFGCACCPSNVCRFMASVPGYAYAVGPEGIYVNLYLQSTAELSSPQSTIRLTQHTDYPWDGDIAVTVAPASGSAEFALFLRIPGWARNQPVPSTLYSVLSFEAEPVQVEVNGEPYPVALHNGYVVIDRTWSTGDTVRLYLPMPVQRIACDARVAANVGRVALQRGPLVYCVEGLDVEGGQALDVVLPDTTPLEAVHLPDLLGGVTVLEGTGHDGNGTARRVMAIPYYAWAHRGDGPMTVWMTRAPGT